MELLFVGERVCYSQSEAERFEGLPMFYSEAVKALGKSKVKELIETRQLMEETRLENEGWIYIPQEGCHAGHWVSPEFAAKHSIPPYPNGTMKQNADWAAHLRHPYDREMDAEHCIYFP